MFLDRRMAKDETELATWTSRIDGRRFRNPQPDQLSPSNGPLGEFADHVGDWCENGPDATLITSLAADVDLDDPDVIQLPVLDLDIEHLYFPSTTPGHGGLLLNVELNQELWLELLDVLERCGIIEGGFAEASRQRGYAALRTPWTDKIKPEPNPDDDVIQVEDIF